MDINYQLIQVMVLAMTAVAFTASMTCNKMIVSVEESSTTVKFGANNDVMEMGQYIVRTTRRTKSASVQDLVSNLHGASDINYKHKSFTAVLQPKDLKKVHM